MFQFDKIREYRKPYIIAEIGSNHNGNMELAKRLINAAKECGADCVKFQSWSKDTIFSKKVYENNFFCRMIIGTEQIILWKKLWINTVLIAKIIIC